MAQTYTKEKIDELISESAHESPKLYLISFDKFGNAGQTYCRFYSKTPITTFSELYGYLEANGYTISNKLTIFGNCDGNKSGTTKIVTGHPINIYYNSAYNTVGVTLDRYIYTLSIVDGAISIATELRVESLSISSTDNIHLKCEEVR